MNYITPGMNENESSDSDDDVDDVVQNLTPGY